MPEYAERVQAGMARLDAHFGDRASWREDIDTGALDLASWRACVLGQLFGNFDAGMSELGISRDEHSFPAVEAVDLGFYLPDDEVDEVGSYPDLTAAWVAALTA